MIAIKDKHYYMYCDLISSYILYLKENELNQENISIIEFIDKNSYNDNLKEKLKIIVNKLLNIGFKLRKRFRNTDAKFHHNNINSNN